MTDLLLRVGLSNLVLSLLLALVAWAVHRTGKRPYLAHMLWLVVLVKLVTPPVVSLPGIALPQWAAGVAEAQPPAVSMELPPAPPTALNVPASEPHASVGAEPAELAVPALPRGVAEAQASPAVAAAPAGWAWVKPWLLAVWLSGSVLVLVFTLCRVVCFGRLLRGATTPAAPDVQRRAQKIGTQLGLRRVPTVYTTAARLSPMVWWAGGEVRVVLPEVVAHDPVPGRMRWALAHELAHVKRRDHWVRWVEWLACVVFWWNPVAWVARRNLRANEEVCCDALVLARFDNNPTSYADAILSVVESLARPALRAPAIASEINSGDTLQRRFDMILSSKIRNKTPRWASTLVLLGAVGLMPLGLAQAGDSAALPYDAATKQSDKDVDVPALLAEIRAAVERGDITPEEGRRKAQEVRSWVQALEADRDDRAPRRDRGDRREREGDRDADGIEAKFHAWGVDEAGFDAIVEYLAKEGVGRIQMEVTLGGLLRVAYTMKEQGEDYDFDERMHAYFSEEVGLDDGEIEAVLGVAEKLAQGHAQHDGEAEQGEKDKVDIRGYFLRLGLDEEGLDAVVGTLHEHGVGRVQMESTLGGLFHTVLGIQEHGLEATVEDEKFHAFFAQQVGLDEEQIELVTRLAQRIARATQRDDRDGERESDRREREGERETDRRERDVAPERRERQERERAERRERREREAERERDERGEARQGEDKVDLAAYAGRVRSAFASGEMDADEARRHMDGLRERMVHEVELALEAEKITRDEAREKVAAIREMTQLPDRDGDHRDR